ncbi:MAG TPA: CRISPR-associated endonuclease Cas1 [Pyrinomonadaceae bacterium]|nr:CRISPR-associated endonuclease Cas1 [Pyrinomonadaceae bacterium]
MSLPTPDSPVQLPARMLNEFAYCPRLFYLEYVQQEWNHSADTLEGRFIHRRVDQQAGSVPAADEFSEGQRVHARSISIGSDQLGAVAKIDVLEGEDGVVTPVDYKRGSPPDNPERSWEPERVQLCMQGLLLRENGYSCDEGVLFFKETQDRITIPFTGDLIARTLELLTEARRVAESGSIPPPLVDSPKCPRCSLVGICLPDEVNLLRMTEVQPSLPGLEPDEQVERGPRGLSVGRDDKLALYVQGQGHSVGLKGDVLEIRNKKEIVNSVRLREVSQVSLFGAVQLSAQALRELAARDVTILHLSYGGWLAAVTTPPPHKNIELRRRQFQVAENPRLCLYLARLFVSGKIQNSRTLLRRNARELQDNVIHRLADHRRKAERAEGLSQLLGMEGMAARDYFANFARMLKTNSDALTRFDFETRNRRPPRDPVNALLSFLYSMLAKDMMVTLVRIGFDPYLGFYHQPRYGRPALALDLIEEFRPLIADSVAIGVMNNGEVRPSDFITRGGSVALKADGRKRLLEAYERRLDTEVMHPRFGYSVSYRRIFEIQARLLARFLSGEIPGYEPFCTR